MFKVLIATFAISCALAAGANAAGKPAKKELTEEQKKMKTEMLEKYDKNKDGKLDAEEKKAMSTEDKDKLDKAGLGKGGKGGKAK